MEKIKATSKFVEFMRTNKNSNYNPPKHPMNNRIEEFRKIPSLVTGGKPR